MKRVIRARWISSLFLAAAVSAVVGLAPACEVENGEDENEEQDAAVPSPEPFCNQPPDEVEERIDAILPAMSLAEKVAQMAGLQKEPINSLFHTPADEKHGLPGFKMVDGPRGVRAGNATAFPVAAARGATWDQELEKRVGRAMGTEVAAKGGNVLLAPCINNLRHPRWGRAQETYGEDSFLLGEMGTAFVLGAQEKVIASVKHFAANSIENTRFLVNVDLDEVALQEVYLPHFRKVVQNGRVGTVMSAYNSLNGSFCSANEHLLRDLLKGEWGFQGLVESDWVMGTKSTAESALAGLDIEMPRPVYYGDRLVKAVEGGDVPESVIDEAVRRILRVQFCFGLDRPPEPPDPGVVEGPEHLRLALEVAQKGIVLLRNQDRALPLDRSRISSLAVVGPLADLANVGDHGSSYVRPTEVITALRGIEERAGQVTVQHIPSASLSDQERALVEAADAAVVVTGYTHEDEGESNDRESLGLSAEQEQLILEVAGANPRTVVVLFGGSAVLVEPWVEEVQALLMAWYPGQQGGYAVADILFGEVNPSGRLPVTFARSASDLPVFDNESYQVEYGYFHGYRLLDRDRIEPRYPFGFGLSYTAFEYRDLALSPDRLPPDGTLEAELEVSNVGELAGEEVVQLYVSYPKSSRTRAVRDLKAFARIALDPGQRRKVKLGIPVRDLAFYDPGEKQWRVDPGDYTVSAGSSSRDLPLTGSFTVESD